MAEQRALVEQLVATYADTILRLAYARTGSYEDARDVCQTVFLKLLALEDAGRAQFAGKEHEKAWIIRTALNACHDLARSGWRRKVVPLEGGAHGQDAPSCSDGLAALADAERDEELLAAVNALPPAYRQAIYLHYYEGFSAAAIAGLTGESAATVTRRLSRGRDKLRDMLGDF